MSDQQSHAHGPVVEVSGQGHAAGHGHDHGDHAGHSTGIAKYVYVFIALCLLTTLSFLTYSDWWRSNFTPAESRMLMLAVSCCKAMLVILFFMHVLWEANWKYVLTIPAALMSIFLILMLVPDVGNRMRRASEERAFHAAEVKSEEHKGADHKPPAHSPAGQSPSDAKT